MSESLYAELRAVKAPSTEFDRYSWHIEGRDHGTDPFDPEAWGWVADVDGTEFLKDREPGETARLFAAAPALVDALDTLQEQFRKWWPGCLECEHDGDEHCVVCRGELALEQARAALALAQWQDKAVQG